VVCRIRLIYQHGLIVPIHGDDDVKYREVLIPDTACANIRHRVSTTFCRSLRTPICGLIRVIRVRSCRIDLELVAKTGLLHKIAEYTFGCGRTTYVAHADEQNTRS
jgi:hypothetical protein